MVGHGDKRYFFSKIDPCWPLTYNATSGSYAKINERKRKWKTSETVVAAAAKTTLLPVGDSSLRL